MIGSIKRIHLEAALEENDIMIVTITKDESIKNTMEKLKEISDQIGINFLCCSYTRRN